MRENYDEDVKTITFLTEDADGTIENVATVLRSPSVVHICLLPGIRLPSGEPAPPCTRARFEEFLNNYGDGTPDSF